MISIRMDAEAGIEALLCESGGCEADCIPQADPGFTAMCRATTHHCVAVPINHPYAQRHRSHHRHETPIHFRAALPR